MSVQSPPLTPWDQAGVPEVTHEAFVAFSRVRDGSPDFALRQLSAREEYFEGLGNRLEAFQPRQLVEQKTFDEYKTGARDFRTAQPKVAWLVRIARANESEAWGVERLLKRHLARVTVDHEATAQERAELQEVYHTRLLQVIVSLFGLDMNLAVPPWPLRAMIAAEAMAPVRITRMSEACAELVGTVAFQRLLNEAEVLFADDPPLLAFIVELLDEILIDEIGHVSLQFGSLSAREQAIARRLILPGAKAVISWVYFRGRPSDARELRDGVDGYSYALFNRATVTAAFLPPR